jgi:hypothetical protein
MLPEVGLSMPASNRSNEDFPLPDGPTIAVSAARGNSAVIPLRACTLLVGVT